MLSGAPVTSIDTPPEKLHQAVLESVPGARARGALFPPDAAAFGAFEGAACFTGSRVLHVQKLTHAAAAVLAFESDVRCDLLVERVIQVRRRVRM